ncbi:MAG: hypothetical protein ACREST_06085 [Steroidobacteraceae bacterium]
MRLPLPWNRSRATALGLTLALHVALAMWLLALRFELPEELPQEHDFLSLPVPAMPPPPRPLQSDLPPPAVAPITAPPQPMPDIPAAPPATPDWSREAREVAKGFDAGPSYRPFGETPKGPAERPKDQYPPSIWPKPLPRVGKTVVTPEGETITWVSDNCWVSISSRSLTQKELHDARKGVRMCQIGAGKKEPRDDLFDSIKRPPPPQEPGCDREGVGLSCAR